MILFERRAAEAPHAVGDSALRRAPLYPRRARRRRRASRRTVRAGLDALVAALAPPSALALLTALAASPSPAAADDARAAPTEARAGTPAETRAAAARTPAGGSTPAPTRAPTAERPAGTPGVAVASSLRTVWPRLARAWRDALPDVDARASFGASHTLARQIERGAPYELFLAADEESLAALPPGRVVPGSEVRYARGRLVLVQREVPPVGGVPEADTDAVGGAAGGAVTGEAGSEGARDAALRRLAARLAADPSLRLAIANPVHAPYGRAAREALDATGLWPLAPGRLVVGENAAQALQFLRAGAVDAALVPRSLGVALPPGDFRTELVDPRAHAPLEHRLVALAGASPAALALGRWLVGEAARAVLVEAGFDVPP